MTAATLFSGIGAPEVAMPGWRFPWHAEIEKFPSAVMAARHPNSVNLGNVTADDFTERAAEIARPDVIVFGSPCQSYSIAGKRLGLDDPRGNLALVALGIVARLEPDWFVFENVPGLLSSSEGRDFGIFLRTVDELGYSGAWASLDAQWFGVAQRRERLFFVGHSGDWRGPAAVLLEPESLCGHSPPRRETGERPAPAIASRPAGGGRLGTDFDCDGGLTAFGGNNTRGPVDVSTAVNAHGGPHGRLDFESETFVAHALRADGFDASEDGTGRGTPLIPVGRNLAADHVMDRPVGVKEAGAVVEVGNLGPLLPVGVLGGPSTVEVSRRNGMAGSAQVAMAGNGDDAHAKNIPVVGFSCKDHGGKDGEPALVTAYRTSGNCGAWDTGERTDALTTGTDQSSHLIAFSSKDYGADLSTEIAPTMRAMGHTGSHANAGAQLAVAIALRGPEGGGTAEMSDVPSALRASQGGGDKPHVLTSAVRRLTPRECERLQGFPDDYSLVAYRGKPAADGPRYKALGNSMAVPVMRWILSRIEAVATTDEKGLPPR